MISEEGRRFEGKACWELSDLEHEMQGRDKKFLKGPRRFNVALAGR
jgi:hypothetical protein